MTAAIRSSVGRAATSSGLLVAALALVATACGGASDRACVPGIQEACACPGGQQGAQACTADGKGFGECVGCGASADMNASDDMHIVDDMAAPADMNESTDLSKLDLSTPADMTAWTIPVAHTTPALPLMGQVNTIDLGPLGPAYAGMTLTFTPSLVGTTEIELQDVTLNATATAGITVQGTVVAFYDPADFTSTQAIDTDFYSGTFTAYPGGTGLLGATITPYTSGQNIGFSFASVMPSTGMGDSTSTCSDLTDFAAFKEDLLGLNGMNLDCNSCHNTGGSGNSAFNMAGFSLAADDAASCATMLSYVTIATPSQSDAYLVVSGGKTHQGGTLSSANQTAFLNALTTWLKGEDPASVMPEQSSLSLRLNEALPVTVTITPNGRTGSATLSLANTPAGLTATFNPATVTLGSAPVTSVMTVTAASNMAVVTNVATNITATVGATTSTTTFGVTIIPKLVIRIPKGTGVSGNNHAVAGFPKDVPVLLPASGTLPVDFYNDDTIAHQIHADGNSLGMNHEGGDLTANGAAVYETNITATGTAHIYCHDHGGTAQSDPGTIVVTQ